MVTGVSGAIFLNSAFLDRFAYVVMGSQEMDYHCGQSLPIAVSYANALSTNTITLAVSAGRHPTSGESAEPFRMNTSRSRATTRLASPVAPPTRTPSPHPVARGIIRNDTDTLTDVRATRRAEALEPVVSLGESVTDI